MRQPPTGRGVAFDTAKNRARRSRRLRCALGSSALALVLVFAAVGTAAAEDIHTTPTGEYGKEAVASSGTGTSCRITYQEAEKRLYLLSDGEVYGLEISSPGTAAEISGYPISSGLGNDLYCGNNDIQVDNTNGPSKGRYYTTHGGSELTAFNPDGTRVGSPWPVISTFLCSTAVLPNGDVWGLSEAPQPPTISRFTASGEQLTSLAGPEGCPQLAIDPSNSDLYFEFGYGLGNLRRYTAASNYTVVEDLPIPVRQGSDYAVNGALHRIYITTPSGFEAYDTENGEKLESVPTGGEAHSLTLDEATDTVFVQVGNGASGRIKEFAPSIVPTVTTEGASNEGLVSGTIEALDDGPVTGCVVEYGFEKKPRSEAYEHSVPCAQATPFAEGSTTAVTAQLTGLIGETVYHYRLVAENGAGKGFGRDAVFTPHYVDDVVTEDPTLVTTSSATLKASFEGNSEDTKYFFEWGLKGQPYEHSTPVSDAGSPSTTFHVSANIADLTSDTAYHYRVVMENAKGQSPGNDVEFSSEHAVKELGYEPISNLTSTSVRLNGTWVGEGGLDTHYFFEWGFDTGSGFEHSTPAAPADGGSASGFQVHSIDLSDLVPSAGYRYRIVASNTLGTSTGATMTFETLPFPSVVYEQPSEYEPDSVTLNALVNPNGGGATTFHYEYGLTTAYGSSTPESESIGSDSSEHPASAKITGLAPGTTYHYRLVATAPGGSYVSPDDEVVTTLPIAPTVVDSAISERSPTAATVDASVKPGFGSTIVFFRYGSTPAYGEGTVPGPALAADNETHSVSARLENLAPDTTYHYQVVAINFNGSTTTSDRTFETGGIPRVSQESATGITDTTAQITAQVNPNLSPTTVHIEYGTSSTLGSSSAESAAIGSDETDHGVAQTLTGLTPATVYYYRVVGSNQIASSHGEEQIFRTAAATQTEPRPKPKPRCKKGFVRKHRKCVKKPEKHKRKKHKHKRKKHHRHGRGGK